MIRWNVLMAGAVAIVGAAFVTGASIPPRPAVGTSNHEGIKTGTVIGQKIGFFNMARVMREYRRAQTSVERLNARKNRLSKNLVGLRAMHDQLKIQIDREASKTPPDKNEDLLFRLGRDVRTLARLMEDSDREIGKLLQNQATTIIGELYDDVHTTTASIARDHGLVVVFAYPDGVTPEERENPMVKELKLKPPAAQPFYLDASVDYTDELLERLNARFAAETGGN